MEMQFYEDRTIKLPRGELKITPFCVEDRKIVLELMKILSDLDVIKSKKGAKEPIKMAEFTLNRFIPLAWKLAQRCVKRQNDEYKEMDEEELDKQPDIPMSTEYAIKITNEMISISLPLSNVKKKTIIKKTIEKS